MTDPFKAFQRITHMRKFLTFIMMIFMPLGPVASLSAQVNQLDFQEESVQAMSMQMTGEEDIQHSCCEDNQCHCSYQN